MSPARCWSVSRLAWLPMEQMNSVHLVNAHMKFLDGRYLVPADEDDPLVLRPLTAAEHAQMAADFEAEVQRRIAAGDEYVAEKERR